MRVRFTYLLALGAAAAMIGAPTALAAGQHQQCTNQGPWGTDVVCVSPGNAQINASMPPVRGGAYAGGFYAGGPYAVPFAR